MGRMEDADDCWLLLSFRNVADREMRRRSIQAIATRQATTPTDVPPSIIPMYPPTLWQPVTMLRLPQSCLGPSLVRRARRVGTRKKGATSLGPLLLIKQPPENTPGYR